MLFPFFLCACGSGEKSVQVNGADIPAWALTPPDLCSAGSQTIGKDFGAAQRLAESRARTGMSRQLETKVKSMIVNYNQEGRAEDGEISEALSTEVTKLLSKQTLNGSTPVKAKVSNNQYFSLVCLKPNALTEALEGMKALNDAQRKALSRRAKTAQKDLEKEMKAYDE